ncbi:unnamed protein product [Clavelina lepadiformis]|uniref:DNA repair endonuclease XPF n=1 Tax=Clavelina lepadiformis TaxID=159417 RepID=A0ABP0G1Y4_CLALP
MKNLLEYEQQIVSDVFNESCLLVMCEGLGLDRIMLHFLHLYSDMNEFVFVLNTSYIQQDYYIEQLRLSGVNQPPRAITSESTVVERKKMYANGGIFFASSRILVMDLLMDRIPIHLISGLIVNKAHKVATMCQEQFIMRLYRQKNRDGFIKAFTDNPVALVGGYGKLPRVMKALYVGKVFLWPRFHSSVAACLEKHKPEVVELCIKMTSSMKLIQTALLEIVNACLRELKENNPQIESDELTLENSLGKSFDRSVRVQLDPIWNQLGSKTKRLVSDLRLLRLLLQALSQYDCVTFLKLLESSMSTPKSFGKNPGWIFLDASNNLFTYARNRVYGDQSNIYTEKKEKTTAPLLEISPKWEALKEILNEITEVNEKTSAEKLGQGKVLICVSDVREIYLIRDILQSGYRPTLMCLYNKMIGKTKSVSTSAVECTESAFSALEPNVADKSGKTTNLSSEAGRDKDERKYFSMKVLDHPETHLHTLHGNPDHYSLTRSLDDIKPRYVIMYDSSIHFIRQLEVYKACHAGFPLRVYFLMYESSAEEQIYLTALRKEKEAFHSLIQGKSVCIAY